MKTLQSVVLCLLSNVTNMQIYSLQIYFFLYFLFFYFFFSVSFPLASFFYLFHRFIPWIFTLPFTIRFSRHFVGWTNILKKKKNVNSIFSFFFSEGFTFKVSTFNSFQVLYSECIYSFLYSFFDFFSFTSLFCVY